MKDFKYSAGAIFYAFCCLLGGFLLGIYIDFIWFARFGALIVLFGVMSEYGLLQKELQTLYQALKGQGASVFGNSGIGDLSPSPLHQRFALCSHITIVLGTLIWGFGDWALEWVIGK